MNYSPRNHRAFSTIEPLESRIAPAVIIVTTTADDPIANKTTLRQALFQADADLVTHPGVVNTIIFKLLPAAAHTENIILLDNGALTSNGDVNIIGPGAGKLIINAGGASGVFAFGDPSSQKDSPVSISGLSIIDGNASSGAGISSSSDSLTLKNCVVSGNTASLEGGGVFVGGNSTVGTKVSISNSLITDNSGLVGGGVLIQNVKSFNLTNTVITGNGGGGAFAKLEPTGSTGGTITGCLIANNNAGGLTLTNAGTLAASKITISHTVITGNSGAVDGGGVALYGGNTVITGSTIENNTAQYFGGGVNAGGYALPPSPPDFLPGPPVFGSLTISGSAIKGNKISKNSGGEQGGGGLSIQGANPSTPSPVKIIGSNISDNTSPLDGGGVLAQYGVALSVTGCTFSGNSAPNGIGGAIATRGDGSGTVNLTVTGSLFSGNIGGHGGGIAAEGESTGTGNGTFTLAASKLSGNMAAVSGGGLIVNTNGAVTIKNTLVADNSGLFYGGGLDINVSQNVVVTGGLVSGNFAHIGGGMFLYKATGTVQDVTITGNAASVSGGGVDVDSTSTFTLKADAIFANTAPSNPDVFGMATF